MGYADPRSETLLTAALGYARGGWPVFPLAARSKRPATPNGLNDATTDLRRVETWWRRQPTANIGLPIPRGLVVVDIDSPDALPRLKAHGRTLPGTVSATTGRGRHLWYSTGSIEIRNQVGIFEGVDIRGPGGYVVAPPSLHDTGVVYEWDVQLERGSISEAPDWLMEILTEPSHSGRSIDPQLPNRQHEWADILGRTYDEGCRNQTLARVCGHLFAHLPARSAEAIAKTWAAGHLRPPLPTSEVQRTIQSIAKCEARKRSAQ